MTTWEKVFRLLFFKLVFLCVALSASASVFAANAVTAARVWPAQDYTRVTLEADAAFKYQLLVLKNPDRLVLDIENIEHTTPLKALADKILSSDPYIKQVRTAKFKANVVRIVIDLKAEVKSNLFALPPAGDYKHRLVLDIYPLQDLLMAMLSEKEHQDKLDVPQPKPIIEPLPPSEANSPSEPVESAVDDSKTEPSTADNTVGNA
ncbi:MAG: AMIN domain-containing protein, partial [Methylophilaceae bacterium]